MKFHIISAMFNFSDKVCRNIEMLKKQSHADFQCVLIDDLSTDDTVDQARKAIGNDSRFKLTVNTERKFKVRNIVEGIRAANADDNDVIVVVDADDYLAHENCLQIIAQRYEENNCWMTYGSYQLENGQRDRQVGPYSAKTVTRNHFRKVRWRSSHPRTFLFKLFKRISPDAFSISPEEYRRALVRSMLKGRWRQWYYWKQIDYRDLLDASGQYTRRIDDRVLLYPMLEMAGPRACFIPDILYIYDMSRTDTGSKTPIYGQLSKKWSQRLIRHIIRHKKPYPRLQNL
ncbi:MAG: glycosyltransferase [Gammaproteobacteria bacterium]|jgi:glycosyltransferase involved in cell wall biosynthesis